MRVSTVEKRAGLPRAELVEALKDSDGLIVRSETKVTADLLDDADEFARHRSCGSWCRQHRRSGGDDSRRRGDERA